MIGSTEENRFLVVVDEEDEMHIVDTSGDVALSISSKLDGSVGIGVTGAGARLPGRSVSEGR